MTEQPPAQPPNQPTGGPSNPQGEGNPATQQMPAASSIPATPPRPPKGNPWRRATSTPRGRWALGLGAAALVVLMLLGVGVATFAVLRLHDRFNLVGNRQDGFSRGQDRQDQNGGQGFDQGPGANGGNHRHLPGTPGTQGGRAHGPGGLGGFLGGTALHGAVTASANGSVQSLVFQRGEVTAVSDTSISLKSSDGFTGTYGLSSATTANRGDAVKGGQAFVLARASDKVAITVMAGKTSRQ